MARNIFISAGDISGDFHAGNLVKSLKKLDPGLSITSTGGRSLSAVSDNFLANVSSLSAFGFFAPFKHYLALKKVFEKIKGEWDRNRPDAVVLVDYYGFNIHIAKEASERKIPIFYYISPQVWASRAGRVRKLAKYVKKMLVILPFEESIYKNAGVDAVFVGHPLLDELKEENNNNQKETVPVIGLFPGSRSSVLRRHMPIINKVAELINNQIQVNFKIFITEPSEFPFAGKYQLLKPDNLVERSKLSLAITTSGTVSLENALLGIPMVVFYKLSWFNYLIAKLLVNIKYITMANILLGKEVVSEFIQSEAKPEKIAAKAVALLKDKENTKLIRTELMSLRDKLGKPGVSDRVAKIILEEIKI